jgi:hypothetical protein
VLALPYPRKKKNGFSIGWKFSTRLPGPHMLSADRMPNQSPQPTRLLGLRFPTARVRPTVRCQSKKTARPLPRAAEL